MPRLSISLTTSMHTRLTVLATEQSESLSHLINRLIQIGLCHFGEISTSPFVEQHCQQLIIQMNALIKNMSVEILKVSHDDFETLREAALKKYDELMSTENS